MNRRAFHKKSFQAAALIALGPGLSGFITPKSNVRLGAPLFENHEDEEE